MTKAMLMMLLAEIDMFIHTGIAELFKLIFRIVEVDIFGDAINDIANRIYGILGVFILFKIIISAVQYLINPDKLTDKDKGAAGLLQRTIISIALLALVPTIFQVAKEVEVSVSSAIPSIILGQEFNPGETDGQTKVEKVGSWLAFSTMKAFINVKEEKQSIVDNNSNLKIENFDDIRNNLAYGCTGIFFGNSDCVYDYNPIFSLLVGGFMIIILASMGCDIAVRTIKLGILQLLAPIPIASYINNQENFKAWYQNAFKVYVDLFIRLIVIYFIVYIMVILASGKVSIGNEKVSFFQDPFVAIYIIIGLLMFAKQAPKFICDILGIKSDGFGDIGKMFTRAGGFAGATLGATKAALSNYVTQNERFKSKNAKPGRRVVESLKSAAAGAVSATGRGVWMAAQGKGFNDVRQGTFKNTITARDRRIDRVDNLYNREKYLKDARGQYILDSNGNKIENSEYYTYKDAMVDRMRNNLGIPSNQEFIKTRYDVMEQTSKTVADAKGHGAGKMNETPSRYRISIMDDVDGRVISDALGYKELSMEQVRGLYSIAKNGGEVQTANGNKITLTNTQLESLGQVVQNIEKRTSYLKEAELMSTGDPAATTSLNKLRMIIKNNKTMYNNAEIMKPVIEKMSKYNLSVNTIDDMLIYMEELDKIQNKMPNPPQKHQEPIVPVRPSNYETDIEARTTYENAMHRYEIEKADYDLNRDTYEREYQNAMNEYETKYNAWRQEVDYKANIINGIKDSFEEITKRQYPAAQVAQSRAEKAKKASENDKK